MKLLNKKKFALMLVVVFLIAVPSSAFASYSYHYGDTYEFNYADNCVDKANDAMDDLGHSYSYYIDDDFCRDTFLENCDSGSVVYCYAHGTTDLLRDAYGVFIDSADVVEACDGDYKKFVFLNGCYTASDYWWAACWGITNGDGEQHAFLGWQGVAYDNYSYYKFNKYFWQYMVDGYNVDDATYAAYYMSDVNNYGTVGDITSWTF